MSHGVFEQNRAQVYAWAYRLLQNHHDALDVTQEVFIKWWRANGEGSVPANPRGWLRRVTVNSAIDGIRAAARRRSIPATERPVPSEASEAARRETARQIAAALETLTERQRCVVVAKVFDGCTFAEIAEQIDVAVPTVKSHYLRGLQALRNKLPTLRLTDSSDVPWVSSGDQHGP